MKGDITMPRRSLLALFLTAASFPLFAADTYTIDKNHSDASFKIRHFATKVRGGFNEFEGAIQADTAQPTLSSVTFKMKSGSIDTKNADRDKHLKSPDFFDADKCPDISFQSSKITSTGKDKYDVAGTLTMHCVSKPITIPVTFLGFAKDPWGNERASFEIVTKLNRKDFGINWNKALDAGGMMLSDDVDVEINLETVKKKPEAAAGATK
jgi:polyisoprenoid-binding protein YceI